MINQFAVFNQGGTILFQTTAKLRDGTRKDPVPGNPINNLITDVLLEDRQGDKEWKQDRYTLKWTLDNKLKLVFVAVYLMSSNMGFVEDLLQTAKQQFVKQFQDTLSLAVGGDVLGQYDTFHVDFGVFEEKYDKILAHYQPTGRVRRQRSARKPGRYGRKNKPAVQAAEEDDAAAEEDAPDSDEKPAEPARPGKVDTRTALERFKSKRGRGNKTPGKYKPKKKGSTPKKKEKVKREWSQINRKKGVTERDMAKFDFSTKSLPGLEDEQKQDTSSYEVDDIVGSANLEESDEESDDIDYGTAEETGKSSSSFWGMFSNITGSKTLTEADIVPALEQLKSQLQEKNVATDIAAKLCESVQRSLVGTTTGAFTTIKGKVKEAVTRSLKRILTPANPVNILHGIKQAQSQGRPYTIVFVGVNGVGKSTSLAKVTHYLKNSRNLKVSIAACDTFRAGAV